MTLNFANGRYLNSHYMLEAWTLFAPSCTNPKAILPATSCAGASNIFTDIMLKQIVLAGSTQRKMPLIILKATYRILFNVKFLACSIKYRSLFPNKTKCIKMLCFHPSRSSWWKDLWELAMPLWTTLSSTNQTHPCFWEMPRRLVMLCLPRSVRARGKREDLTLLCTRWVTEMRRSNKPNKPLDIN